MANFVTVKINTFPMCKTDEEQAAHEAGCHKLGIETGKGRSVKWLCVEWCARVADANGVIADPYAPHRKRGGKP